MRKVRSERFLAKCHATLGAALLLLPLVAGCTKEVPYAAPEGGTPTAEQPATGEEKAPAFDAEPAAPEDSATETPATETAETPPAGLPWEAAEKPAAAPKEAGDLFAAVDKPSESAAKPQAAVEDKKSSGGFGDILDEAYGSTAQAEPADEPEMIGSPATEPLSSAEQTAEPSPDEGAAADAEDWWNQTTTPSPEPTAKEEARTAAPPIESPPEPKAPATDASSNADLLDELFGEDPEEPAAKPAHEETAPAVKEPLVEESPTLPDDESLFEEPQAEADQADVKQPQQLESLPTPIVSESEVAEPEVAKPQAAGRAAPMAADVMQPLPAVPVLEFNTRHLAWLLGGKLGLAELADLDGATPTEVAEWRGEVERLAKSLGIAAPGSKNASAAIDERVQNLLRTASDTGVELKHTHGVDHAALMEIALKTNALLVVAKDHPDLAASVGRAVEEAAERAMLPKFLWEDSVRVLKSSPDAEAAHDAVVRLHQRVESFLR